MNTSTWSRSLPGSTATTVPFFPLSSLRFLRPSILTLVPIWMPWACICRSKIIALAGSAGFLRYRKCDNIGTWRTTKSNASPKPSRASRGSWNRSSVANSTSS
eukprot:2076657-Rhodomonas_salina.3